MSSDSETRRVAIVGAGLSGLSAGAALESRGYPVQIFDKGRGPGGRMARRRAGDYQFDHGAQYFTTRDSEFEKQVVAWRTAGIAAPWNPTLVVLNRGTADPKRGGPPRYVGTPGMNAPARALASNLDVSYGMKIRGVTQTGSGYVLTDDRGVDRGAFTALVLAVTPEQAEPLFPRGCSFAHDPLTIRLDPCWAVMVVFAERPGSVRQAPPFDAAFVHDSPLSWAARNASKPLRPGNEAWVLHASRTWSSDHEEDSAESVAGALLDAFRDAMGVECPDVLHLAAHRWRYAQARAPLKVGSLWDADRRVGLCGDWCSGSRVEGAYLSGLRAAEAVSQMLDA